MDTEGLFMWSTGSVRTEARASLARGHAVVQINFCWWLAQLSHQEDNGE
jgi:hypothetical protein